VRQQPAGAWITAVRASAFNQSLGGEDAPVDVVRPGQRDRAREACSRQHPLSVHARRRGFEIDRFAVRLDDHGTTILQVDTPHSINTARPKPHASDRTAQPVLGLTIQKGS
jgi:hypothetical protein